MKIYKAKIKDSIGGEPTKIKDQYGQGYCVTVHAVSYSSNNPNSRLVLFDGQGDQFMFGLPGQAVPNPTTPEVQTTVPLPLSYVDDSGGNEIVIWGVVDKIDNTLTSVL